MQQCPGCKSQVDGTDARCPRCGLRLPRTLEVSTPELDGLPPREDWDDGRLDAFAPAPLTGADMRAVGALVLGALGLIASCLPYAAFGIAGMGIVLGLAGLGSTRRGMAAFGLVLCAVALVSAGLTLAYGATKP